MHGSVNKRKADKLKICNQISLTKFCKHAKSLQFCLTVCDPMDRSPPGSSIHGISEERILEWVAMPSPRGSSLLTQVKGKLDTFLISSVQQLSCVQLSYFMDIQSKRKKNNEHHWHQLFYYLKSLHEYINSLTFESVIKGKESPSNLSRENTQPCLPHYISLEIYSELAEVDSINLCFSHFCSAVEVTIDIILTIF